MEKVKIYKLEKKVSSLDEFVLDVYMEDELKSHRYYYFCFSNVACSIKYIKSIDLILDYIDRLNVYLIELSPQVCEKIITLISKLMNINIDVNKVVKNNDLNYALLDCNNELYFSELINYDKIVLNDICLDSSKDKHRLEKGI